MPDRTCVVCSSPLSDGDGIFIGNDQLMCHGCHLAGCVWAAKRAYGERVFRPEIVPPCVASGAGTTIVVTAHPANAGRTGGADQGWLSEAFAPYHEEERESDWWVYSTALADGVILVENRTTGARGAIHDWTKEEWTKAFHAPSKPYPWTDVARVRVRHPE
jgi:hypothetical protein